jgi:four helix bundle protein
METGFTSLRVFKDAYALAMEIYELSKSFPNHELYSLTDQIRRSSRSVCANIAEAYRKRRYPTAFTSKITDADGECSETTVWLKFSFDCKYLDQVSFDGLYQKNEEIGKMLGFMADHPEKFLPKQFKK